MSEFQEPSLVKKGKEELQMQQMKIDIENLLEGRESYGETLIIQDDGLLSQEKRIGDNNKPFLLLLIGTGEKCNVESLYQSIHELTKILPQFEFEVETDPKGKWIRYKITRKQNPT